MGDAAQKEKGFLVKEGHARGRNESLRVVAIREEGIGTEIGVSDAGHARNRSRTW